ncbi:MAG: hypothetical protein AAB566_02370, partial [Patescibacteria group bacterium]
LNWEKVFSEKKVPETTQEIKVEKDAILIDILVIYGLVKSKTNARRLFKEGAIRNLSDDSKITDPQTKVTQPLVLKIGKKTFVKVGL